MYAQLVLVIKLLIIKLLTLPVLFVFIDKTYTIVILHYNSNHKSLQLIE